MFTVKPRQGLGVAAQLPKYHRLLVHLDPHTCPSFSSLSWLHLTNLCPETPVRAT